MKLIVEEIEKVNIITEEKDGEKQLFIEGIFLQGDIQNKNGRIYPSPTLDKAVIRYINERVEQKRAYGELGHPNGPSINLDRVSHIITELKKDGSNYVGKAKITSTPMGNIVRGLISDGANLGVSSRGMGTLKNKNNIMEVQDDYFIATAADIVADPSAPNAFVNGIMEGVDFIWNNGALITKTAEETKKEIEESARANKLTEQKMLNIFEKFLSKI